MADLYYIDSGYLTPDAGYYTYVADAQSAQSATAGISCDPLRLRVIDAAAALAVTMSQSTTANKIISTGSTLSAAFNQSAFGVEIRDIVLSAGANGTLSATAKIIRDNNIATSAVFSIATDGRRFRNIAVDEAAAFDISISAKRSRATSSSLAAAFSFVAAATKTSGAAVGLSVTATETVNASKLTISSSALSVAASLKTTKYFGTGRPLDILNTTSGQYSSSIKKFGTYSFHGNTNGTQVSALKPDIPNVSESWIIEAWFYPVNSGSQITSGGITFSWGSVGWIWTQAGAQSVTCDVKAANGSSIISQSISMGGSPITNSWAHFALIKDANGVSFYVNGTRKYNTASLPSSYYAGNTVILDNTLGYVDEASLHIGTTLGYSSTSTTITVPTQPRVNNSQYTQALYHFEQNGLDDLTAVEQASAALTVTATLSASARLPIQNAAALLQSSGTLSAVISRTRYGASDLSAAFTQSAIGYKFPRQFTADFNTSFSQTASAIKVVAAQGNQSASATLTADNSRTRLFAADFAAVASELVTVVKTTVDVANFNGYFAQTATGRKTTDVVSSQQVAATLAADNNRTRNVPADLLSSSSLNSTGRLIKQGTSSTSASFSEYTAPAKTAVGHSSMAASFTQVADTAGSVIRITANLNSQFTQTVAVKRTRYTSSALSASVSTNIDAAKVTLFSAAFVSSFAQTAVNSRRRSNSAFFSAVASELVAVIKTAADGAALSAVFAQTASAKKTASARSLQSSIFVANITGRRTRRLSAGLSATASITALGRSSKEMSADLRVTSAISARGLKTTDIHISAGASGTLSVTASRTRTTASYGNTAAFTETAVGTRIRTASANISGVLNFRVTVTQLQNARAALSAAFSIQAQCHALHLDQYVYKIPYEGRAFRISSESRSRAIMGETRIFKIRR